jgi:hypothetical protein
MVDEKIAVSGIEDDHGLVWFGLLKEAAGVSGVLSGTR